HFCSTVIPREDRHLRRSLSMSSNRAELARDLATTTMSCPCFMRSSERRYASLILRRTLFRTWALPILVLTVMPRPFSPFLQRFLPAYTTRHGATCDLPRLYSWRNL